VKVVDDPCGLVDVQRVRKTQCVRGLVDSEAAASDGELASRILVEPTVLASRRAEALKFFAGRSSGLVRKFFLGGGVESLSASCLPLFGRR